MAAITATTSGIHVGQGHAQQVPNSVRVLEIVRPGMEDSESAKKTGKYRDRTSQRVPRQSDAIACPGRGAARNGVQRCTADPGPPQTGTVPGLQRTTSCCAAPGIRERGAFWRNEPNGHFGQTKPTLILAKRTERRFGETKPRIIWPSVVPAKAGTHDHRRWLWVPARAALGRDDDRLVRAKHQPAAVRNRARRNFIVSGLLFTMTFATQTCWVPGAYVSPHMSPTMWHHPSSSDVAPSVVIPVVIPCVTIRRHNVLCI
jgi:hypothetical protein